MHTHDTKLRRYCTWYTVAQDDVTPLHIAACEGRNEIVEFMIKNGVDVNKADIVR